MSWNLILKGLYQRGKISEERLKNSVKEGLITEEEMEEILQLKEDNGLQ